MNRLSLSRRAAIIRALVEGNSIRATARLTGTAKATVLKLLVELGEFCSVYQDHVLRNLPTKRVEADEIWAFVGAKQKRAQRDGDGSAGPLGSRRLFAATARLAGTARPVAADGHQGPAL